MSIYRRVIDELLQKSVLNRSDRVLIVCGGKRDRDVFFENGFTDVTVSNVDTEVRAELAPFKWEYQDAENLTHENEAFDVVVVNDGLHHCHSPHRGLLEMYRVAKRVVIVFENRDSFALNVAKRMGLTTDYEIEAVTFSNYDSGGVANTQIPNFIYRWLEHDVEKAIRSYAPQYKPKITYRYGLELPVSRLKSTKRPFARLALGILAPLAKLIVAIAPKQGNEFGFVVEKDKALQDWLQEENGKISVNRKHVTAAGRAPLT